MIGPRDDIVDWDVCFMSVAKYFAQCRSRDPSTQVGAIIVNEKNIPVAIGYNGLPRKCDNSAYSWERGDGIESKYLFVEHAERNAIHNRGSNSLEGCRMYVTLHPCSDCAKAIIQNGITEVIYLSDKYSDQLIYIAAKMLFDDCGVKLRKLTLEQPYSATIELKSE